VNTSLFYYDYQNIQVPLLFNEVVGANQTRFVNLPKAESYGIEFETVWQPIDHLQILANYSYLNAKVKDGCCFQDPEDPRGVVPGAQLAGNASPLPPTGSLNQDLKGQTLPSSTPHRVTINANYTWETDPGSISASLTYVWRDSTSIRCSSLLTRKSFGQTDARVLFNDAKGKYTVIGYVKNVFDTRGSAGVSGTRLTTGPRTGFVNETVSYVLPRTYGVELQYRF
jgi:iron complex outermembrane receptor protein